MSCPQACILPSVRLAKVEARLLVYRQRVHIRADHQRGPGAAAVYGAYHASLAHAGLVFDAEPGEFAGDQAGGAVFLEGEFGMRVQVAPDLHQFRFCLARQAADGRADIVDVPHDWLPRRTMG